MKEKVNQPKEHRVGFSILGAPDFARVSSRRTELVLLCLGISPLNILSLIKMKAKGKKERIAKHLWKDSAGKISHRNAGHRTLELPISESSSILWPLPHYIMLYTKS